MAFRDEAHAQRKPLVAIIQGMGTFDPSEVVKDIGGILSRVNPEISPEQAQQDAAGILAPCDRPGQVRTTAIHQWRFDEASLWRGSSDNDKIIKIARSIISTGFHNDEPIMSRTLTLGTQAPAVNMLLFGDGQARGLAARLAWHVISVLLCAEDAPPSSPNLARIARSLLHIPTVFEQHGDGSEVDMLVAQAVRQNVKEPLFFCSWSLFSSI